MARSSQLLSPLVAAACLAGTTPSWADPGDRRERLRDAVETYYDGEDLFNGVYVGLGGANAAAGVALITRDDSGLRAAGVAMTSVGAVQLLSGVVYLALSPGWRQEAMRSLARDEDVFLEREGARISSVESMFLYFKLAELTAVVTGMVIGSVGAARGQHAMMGAGAGLGAAASLQLSMEHITHDLAKDYLFTLQGHF